MAKKYCGKLVYIGKGRIGTVTNYEYNETGDAVNESWTCRLLRSKSTVMVTEKPLIIPIFIRKRHIFDCTGKRRKQNKIFY